MNKPKRFNSAQTLQLAQQQHRDGSLIEAQKLYKKVLKQAPENLHALVGLGILSNQLGQYVEALALLEKANDLAPNTPNILFNLGTALTNLEESTRAADCIHAVQKLLPKDPQAQYQCAVAFKELMLMEEALACFRKAIELKPDFAQAHFQLVGTLEMLNRLRDAREAMNIATRSCPNQHFLCLIEAKLLKREGQLPEARALLEAKGASIPSESFQMECAFELGDVCDKLGDYETAFASFQRANGLQMKTLAGDDIHPEHYAQHLDELHDWFTNHTPEPYLPNSEGERPSPVFIVGFPRSGTTLLDSILRSHPDVSVVEEKPILWMARRILENHKRGYPRTLSNITAKDIAHLRDVYWMEMDRHLAGRKPTPVVVDKLPLNIIDAGLIHLLFPDAKYLFALRHPCDCVLSCYMQNFTLNNAMANFLDLESSAKLYDQAMSLWELYKNRFPLDAHTVCYEELVADFEGTVAPVLSFLGLKWDDNVLNHVQTARKRKHINTPSYSQVTQPIYTRAKGRWERYRTQMSPVLPVLMPWADKYGYRDD